MSLTSIASKFFFPRQKALERHFGEGLALQDAVLRYLLSRGRLTEYGRRFGFENIKNYEKDFPLEKISLYPDYSLLTKKKRADI